VSPAAKKAASAASPKPAATARPEPTTTPKPRAATTPKPGAATTPKPGAATTPKPGAATTPKPEPAATPRPEPAAKQVAKTAKAKRPATKKPAADRAVARKEQPRKLTDPRVIRALAHPVRIALLEALLREGPLTATQAAELLADSPGNMSWHLQTLAKYGYVEEAEGGVGRRRPWRLVSMGTSYDENPDDTELSLAATTFTQIGNERAFERVSRWMNERGSYPRDWQRSWFSTNNISYLRPEELSQLGEDILQLILRYRDRTVHPELRPEGSRPVSVLAYGFPIPPTPSGN
jgi:DNA-binding transcriptional ArsR family regulator